MFLKHTAMAVIAFPVHGSQGPHPRAWGVLFPVPWHLLNAVRHRHTTHTHTNTNTHTHTQHTHTDIDTHTYTNTDTHTHR